MLFDQSTPPAQLLRCATLPNYRWTSMLVIIVFICTIYDISFLWIGRFFLVLPANCYLIAITSCLNLVDHYRFIYKLNSFYLNRELQRRWIEDQLVTSGLEVFHQNFSCGNGMVEGRNIYGILR